MQRAAEKEQAENEAKARAAAKTKQEEAAAKKKAEAKKAEAQQKAEAKEKAEREAGTKKKGARVGGAKPEPAPVTSVKPGPRVQVIVDPPPPKREVATVGDSLRQPHDDTPLDDLLAGFVSDEEPNGGVKPHGKHHSWKSSKAGGGLKLKRGIVSMFSRCLSFARVLPLTARAPPPCSPDQRRVG